MNSPNTKSYSKVINFFLVCLVCCLAQTSKAQDLIVTLQNDSINCKINSVQVNFIEYTYAKNGLARKASIPVANVKMFQYKYYDKSTLPNNYQLLPNTNFPKIRVGLYGGFSYRTAKVSTTLPAFLMSYAEELKTGWHIGGDVTYFLNENIGLGMRAAYFNTTNEIDGIVLVYNNGTTRTGKMRDDINITFVGPSFALRVPSAQKRNAFNMALSFGYLNYVNYNMVIDKYEIRGNTVGMILDLGYDVGISTNMALAFQLSANLGSLSELTVSNGFQKQTVKLSQSQRESLNRFDFSIGLRFNK